MQIRSVFWGYLKDDWACWSYSLSFFFHFLFQSFETLFICWWKPWMLQLHTTCAALNQTTSSSHSRKMPVPVGFGEPLLGGIAQGHWGSGLCWTLLTQEWSVVSPFSGYGFPLCMCITAGDVWGWIDGEVLPDAIFLFMVICKKKVLTFSLLAIWNVSGVCTSWAEICFSDSKAFSCFFFYIWTLLEFFSKPRHTKAPVALVLASRKCPWAQTVLQPGCPLLPWVSGAPYQPPITPPLLLTVPLPGPPDNASPVPHPTKPPLVPP